MQQYADIYLLQSHSTCFGCHSTHHQESHTCHSVTAPFLMMGAVTPETRRVILQ